MATVFSVDDIDRIADALAVPAKRDGSLVRFELSDEESGRQLSVELQTGVRVPGSEAEHVLVSVYANSAFLQLQGCTGFLASKELGEVLFVAREAGKVNGLVVEREAGCSLYANVDQALLSTDFTQLPPELIMSSVALSMTESLFDDLG